ncbi:hypothetical protein [Pectobacterium versatile]|uniref:hypothetical protein n=1 Tax=Pectobacterium versatile TaxID=2488639 RepID=UPI00102EC512|nr:hypothetical protein [Pectobacterium versatile]TAI99837.1 hypothetical protein EG332_04335 [Pectobacterium versatile]UEQ10494.1 hypothetical protein LLE50_05115 [Pectobacterium versatile]GKX40323.1 hypothetical protein SOASR014_40620 [Pectobacterium carotovorum subsp. carotovorum]GLX46404.1 hypothetical protein Pcaca01_40720 [Pectobacterium carotovorum subsp. carotovorum]
MFLTNQERKQMIGKRFQSNMNNPDEMAVTVLDVRRANNGFTVMLKVGNCIPTYMGLNAFNRHYPYEVTQ